MAQAGSNRWWCVLVLWAAVAPAFGQVPVATRQKDLDYVATQVPQLHANFYFHLKPADYTQAVQAVQSQISTLTDQQFYVRLAALVALADDPHTTMYLAPAVSTAASGFRAFPLTFRALDDGIFVTGASTAYTRALGTRLVRVESTPIDAVLVKLGTVIPHTNAQWVQSQAEQLLRAQQALQGLDLAPVAATTNLTFQTRGGDQFTLAVAPSNDVQAVFPDPASGPTPEYLQHRDQNYWFMYDAPRRVLYFKYNACQEQPGNPFSTFASQFLAAFDANPVDTVVIDFRGNGGGNDALWGPLVSGLADRFTAFLKNPNLRLYGVIDKGTFSSGVGDAMQLKSPLPPEYAIPGLDLSKLVQIIGAPTGESTEGWGNVKNFMLPSGLFYGQYSTMYFPTPSWITAGPDYPPQVAVPLLSSDYFARHDPVMAAIVARAGNPPAQPSGKAVVVNGASFRVEHGVAPGSFASVFGVFPSGVDQVLFASKDASLVYGGASQINLVVPASLAAGTAAVSVRAKGAEVAAGTVTITAAGPGIFVAEGSDPSQPGAVLNQDSTVNSAANRAARGTIMQIFATGYGSLDANGAAAVQVYFGETPATVLYSAPTPQYPGLWQINARLPAGLSGQVSLYVVAQGIASNAVTIWVQ